MKVIFGILGVIAAVLYAIYGERLPMPIEAWPSWGRTLLMYAAIGFVVGWLVGFAASRIGGDG